MTEAAKEVHRDPDKEEAILHAALHEFADRGYRAADVQVVADKAGVGKGTVYRYFESKEGLFKAVAHAGLQRLERRMLELMDEGGPFFDVVRTMVVAYAAHFQAHPEYVEIMVQERAEFRGSIPDTQLFYRERSQGKVEALLQSAIDDGSLRPVDVRRAVTVIGDALYGVVLRSVIEGRTDQLASDAELTLDLFLDGVKA